MGIIGGVISEPPMQMATQFVETTWSIHIQDGQVVSACASDNRHHMHQHQPKVMSNSSQLRSYTSECCRPTVDP
eukprot:11355952-Karenia_brevis.AAC.1